MKNTADLPTKDAEHLVLENDQMVWEFSSTGKGFASAGLTNKLSGRHFALKEAAELRLTFSGAGERVEIPWWRCSFGPDNDSTPPSDETGIRQGYHQTGFDDSAWGTCSNPSADLQLDAVSARNFPLACGRPPVVYRGYAWFRTWFELPAGAGGEEIVLNLGGYDQTDWNDYWVYVNGFGVGRASKSGQWRTPEQLRLTPDSPAYQSLRFGPGEKNLLAVRTNSYDRHFNGLSDDMMEAYLFDFVLYDQFVTVGAPYQHVVDFEVTSVRENDTAEGPELVVEMVNRQAQVSAVVHYEMRGPVRRKRAEVTNDGHDRKLLLDVELDSFGIEGAGRDGGYGFPATVDDELFCALEHPSGLNRAHEGTVSLAHFPGKWLEPGQTWRSHSAIVGVSPAGEVVRQFQEYIEERTPRKKRVLGVYDSFGITAFYDGLNCSLNDTQNLGMLDLLAQWQGKGVTFDYYSPDIAIDTTSDLKQFKLFSFPDGPKQMIDRVGELGMKFGQWFAVTFSGLNNWRYPKTAPSRVPSPTEAPHVLFIHGYAVSAWSLCVASEPYFSILRDAIVHHVKENHVELIKLDTGQYYCNSTEHDHLPGKYSTEESFNRLLEIVRAVRAANSDVFVMGYRDMHSPFFLLDTDSTSDARMHREAANTSDFPAIFFRDSNTQAMDQTAQFAKWVPPINRDSFGVWLPQNFWGAQMGTVRWQEAVIMDLARGNRLFPQIWGDVFCLEDHDVEFLGRIQGIVKRDEDVFLARQHTIGDPWKDEVYGYAYFLGDHGFLFLNNMSFDSREVWLELGKQIGLRAHEGQAMRLRSHHPGEALLARDGNPDFQVGESITIQLRPFEVSMIEALPTSDAEPGLPLRETAGSAVRHSYAVPVRQAADAGDLDVHFLEEEKLRGRGLEKRVSAFEARLPEYSSGRHILAIVNTFKKDGQWWRREVMSELVQSLASVDDIVIEFARTPDSRECGNHQWAPWIVFSAPLPSDFAGRDIRFAVSSFLPDGVEMTTDLWVIREWWKPRSRPLPNYWV